MSGKQGDSEDLDAVNNDPELRRSRLYNEDLAPTRPEGRNWSTYNYAALWIGMAHSVTTYMLASGLMAEGMNWKQAVFTIMLGNVIVLIPMLLNSYPGTKYGIPFPVLCRASFGVKGANIPAILRALVACGWFGIQTWIGGEALHLLLKSAWPLWGSVPHGAMIAFLGFWLLNMAIVWRGMNAVRWFEGWAAPLVLIVAAILLVYMVKRAHGFGPILATPGSINDMGQFIRKFPLFLTSQIAYWATLSLNMPDFTRFSRSQKAQMWGQIAGLPTTMTFFSTIGVLITSATVAVYGEAIWDPVKLLARSEFSHPFVVVFALISIGVATLSVNVAANVVSPAFDFSNLWPEKINFRIGGTITGIIGILMMPWALLKTAGNYIFTWLVGYSALLGPIAGIIICDFWIIRKKKLHIADLYCLEGKYMYSCGFNHRAIIALLLGVIPNLPGFILQIAGGGNLESLTASWSPIARDAAGVFASIYSFAWLIGFLIAFFTYWLLMRLYMKRNAG